MLCSITVSIIVIWLKLPWASLMAQRVKNLPAMQETQVQSLGWEDPLEKGMASHSSILAWRTPWTEEPCGLQFMGSQRVGHHWMTQIQSLHSPYMYQVLVKFATWVNSSNAHSVKLLFYPRITDRDMYGPAAPDLRALTDWQRRESRTVNFKVCFYMTERAPSGETPLKLRPGRPKVDVRVGGTLQAEGITRTASTASMVEGNILWSRKARSGGLWGVRGWEGRFSSMLGRQTGRGGHRTRRPFRKLL